ncbi:MAG: hypothetical protein IPI91_19875 [Flavobacteriales bacterium]|nr:hypothetical protein [Flavobacteriales bacterium]
MSQQIPLGVKSFLLGLGPVFLSLSAAHDRINGLLATFFGSSSSISPKSSPCSSLNGYSLGVVPEFLQLGLIFFLLVVMLLAQTKVYLLHWPRSLVPLVYTALRSMLPASINNKTTWLNTSLMWFLSYRGTKPTDRVVILTLHPGKPHEMDVLYRCLNLREE